MSSGLPQGQRVVGFSPRCDDPCTPTSVLPQQNVTDKKAYGRQSSLSEALQTRQHLGCGPKLTIRIKPTSTRGTHSADIPYQSQLQRVVELNAQSYGECDSPPGSASKSQPARSQPQTSSRAIPQRSPKPTLSQEPLADDDLAAALTASISTTTASSPASTIGGTPSWACRPPPPSQQIPLLSGSGSGRDSWSLPPHRAQHLLMPDRKSRARQAQPGEISSASVSRRLFDAEAAATTAQAQAHCLREALTKERERVAWLEAQLDLATLQRDHHYQRAAAAEAMAASLASAADGRELEGIYDSCSGAWGGSLLSGHGARGSCTAGCGMAVLREAGTSRGGRVGQGTITGRRLRLRISPKPSRGGGGVGQHAQGADLDGEEGQVLAGLEYEALSESNPP